MLYHFVNLASHTLMKFGLNLLINLLVSRGRIMTLVVMRSNSFWNN
jgi:hypothetical protein